MKLLKQNIFKFIFVLLIHLSTNLCNTLEDYNGGLLFFVKCPFFIIKNWIDEGGHGLVLGENWTELFLKFILTEPNWIVCLSNRTVLLKWFGFMILN
jgi:hypothetical protein